MSYTFNVRAATKALAIQAALSKFDELAAQSPAQASARQSVEASVTAVVAQLADDDEHDVHVTVTGYVMSQPADGDKPRITNAKTAASALLATRAAV